MSTKKDKRIENRGSGTIEVNGFGTLEHPEHTLLFVEREPDNLLTAALLCSMFQGVFTIHFTDRHSINLDITKYTLELPHDNLWILCPSINEYSILFLNRLGEDYTYLGSSTKIEDCFLNEHIHLTKEPVVSVIATHFNLDYPMIAEVAAYTNKYIPAEMDLFRCIRYQYLCFSNSAKELFQLFYENFKCHNSELVLSQEQNDKLQEIFDVQYEGCVRSARNAVFREQDGLQFAFLQGGCPCTLLLNVAARLLHADVLVNACMHRQHFTVLAKEDMPRIYEQYISNFIYSGAGNNSGGGCFEKDCSQERFIDAFLNHTKIHGFCKDRACDYHEFDPTEYEWLDGNPLTERAIYKNFNFTIFLDSYCNADCRFCIEQIKTANTGHIEKCVLKDSKEYLYCLEEALKQIRPFNPSISITGGEPLLSPNFSAVLQLLKKYHFRKTVITSNGSRLEEHIDEIIDAGISHINFSRPHYENAIVQDIMRFGEPNDFCGDYYLNFDKMIGRLEAGGVRTRFNCILSKNGIHSVSEMIAYMEFVRKLGCRHVVFRELMSFNDALALNEEKRRYAEEHRVFVNDLWAQIDTDERFRPSMNMQGHYYYIEIYEYQDMTMVSERANLKCLEDNHELFRDTIYEMIFHPNGQLCSGWDENRDILL